VNDKQSNIAEHRTEQIMKRRLLQSQPKRSSLHYLVKCRQLSNNASWHFQDATGSVIISILHLPLMWLVKKFRKSVNSW